MRQNFRSLAISVQMLLTAEFKPLFRSRSKQNGVKIFFLDFFFLISSFSCILSSYLDNKKLKLIICYISSGASILLRSAVGSTKLIGQLHWALSIVIQSVFCFDLFVYLFTGT